MSPPRIHFKLYVAGESAKSQQARANLERIVSRHFNGDVDIDVVDLLESPHLAKEDGIVAIPTLVRESPAPRTTIVGDLSDSGKVLIGLGAATED